jgi:hypothetical protein
MEPLVLLVQELTAPQLWGLFLLCQHRAGVEEVRQQLLLLQRQEVMEEIKPGFQIRLAFLESLAVPVVQ